MHNELHFESNAFSGSKQGAANVFHQDFRAFVEHQKN